MSELVKLIQSKNGKDKIEFSLLSIYQVLKDLGFSYTTISNKGYFLRNKNGKYSIVQFFELKDAFVSYLITEYGSKTNNEITEAFYRQSPIKKGNFARQFLKDEHISDIEKQYLLVDFIKK